jgi:hypothetical protein
MVGPAILPLVFEDAWCEALSFTATCKRGKLRRREGKVRFFQSTIRLRVRLKVTISSIHYSAARQSAYISFEGGIGDVGEVSRAGQRPQPLPSHALKCPRDGHLVVSVVSAYDAL